VIINYVVVLVYHEKGSLGSSFGLVYSPCKWYLKVEEYYK